LSLKTKSQLPNRKSIRLQGWDYSNPGMYFVTIVLQERKPKFGEILNKTVILNEIGKLIEKWWISIPNRYNNASLDSYIIMPDHLHGIISINESVRAIHESPQPIEEDIHSRRQMTLSKIMGYFKMNTTKQINLRQQTPGNQIWQRGYYDRIIRNEDELHNIQNYIKQNPTASH